MSQPITPEQKELFQLITSGSYQNLVLVSCAVNGTPTVAIAALGQDGDNFTITPLFVEITADMILTGPDEQPLEPDEEYGPWVED